MQNRNSIVKRVAIGAAVVIVLIFGFWIFRGTALTGDILIEAHVQRGTFVAEVYSTGQLQAENATFIEVPSELSSRRINIFEIQVTDLVEEGTVVEEGDFVASLDHSAIEELLNDARDELERSLQALEDARIDTNINMSNLRDGLVNARVAVEERRLVMEQSIYESPAVQRQAQLDYERAERNLTQELSNYSLKERQARHSVERALEEVRRHRESVEDIERLFNALDVRAPKPGMVIYSYDRLGSKIRVGSTVSRWAPRIAELPDLSSMISNTFINESDISRIRPGQKVVVGVDAFPEKRFDGEVVTVANIGQILPNSDARVFEVTIRLFGTDPELRPAMTTSNIITVDRIEDVLYIPLEAVYRTDSTRYVFTRTNQIVRQIIDAGMENSNHVVVRNGLEEGQVVFLNPPSNREELPLLGEEIYKEILQREEKAAKDSLEQNIQEVPQRRGSRDDDGERRRPGGEGRRNPMPQ
ncbi:efflux RND transporter periplasmic adaptor subunit [Alkalitalea saponilacus]|uniref:Multidrug resistance efflux pump n=1 Tax=Alkalitalea saponilacus TaxID=889453 RepID=A0A1T5HSC8_9BACT|nr:efflux RND transporter periplasmic adaptor subunit [Alkalitalea saponilacus]ASB48365.1 RND transporter [Alkalitalea saponilacus]SKC23596.1 Multidrug resistance efflux pump [Alkalitalea saponilacus]